RGPPSSLLRDARRRRGAREPQGSWRRVDRHGAARRARRPDRFPAPARVLRRARRAGDAAVQRGARPRLAARPQAPRGGRAGREADGRTLPGALRLFRGRDERRPPHDAGRGQGRAARRTGRGGRRHRGHGGALARGRGLLRAQRGAASRRNAAPRGHGRGLPRARRQSRRAPAHQPIQLPIVARGAVYALLLWAPLASGAWRPWPLAVCGLLVGVGVAAWLLEQIARGRLSWRRTPLDLPVLLLFAYLALQLVLGNRALVAWALAPAQPVGALALDFAAWLAMTILLGLGWLAARTGHARRVGLRALLGTPRVREELLRRYLPMIAVVVMALALVFTLSRGGVLGLGAGLLVFLALLGAVGHARRSALLAGVLLVGVGGYGAWIGVGPLLTRFGASSGASLDRVAQYQASLGMLRDFPLLGVGLGAYREIYFRYQPAAHAAGVVYYPYAHNDVLQLLLELGPLGALLCLFFAWRLVGDLVAAHLLGRGACPVDGGEGEAARRHDRWTLGLAIGALAGAVALLTHSLLDFNVRIPANGLLAAGLLGIATVAAHTRFSGEGAQLLSGARAAALGSGARGAIALIALVVVAGWTVYWVRSGWIGTLDVAVLKESGPAARRGLTERLLARDPGNPRGLNARALDAYQAALAAWTAPPPTPDTRRATAAALLADA